MTPQDPQTPTIDACAFHEWSSISDIAPYLPDGWADVAGAGPRGDTVLSPPLYADPRGSKIYRGSGAEGAVSYHYGQLKEKPIGFDCQSFIEQYVEPSGLDRVVLSYDEGLFATGHPSHYFAQAVVRAANDWTAAEWLGRDPRLYGLILVSTALPDRAASEVRRMGENDRMVGVVLGANGLNLPFGHPVYHPIYDAANELGLPLVIQAGPETAVDSTAEFSAGGIPSTLAEWQALAYQTQMVHVSSMIAQGVFKLFPNLKVLLTGAGVVWIPSVMTKLDYWSRMMPRDTPWLDQMPSEYFANHVRVATYSAELPQGSRQKDAVQKLLEAAPTLRESLVYASCFNNSDWDSLERWTDLLPAGLRDRVLGGTAMDSLFRWPNDGQVNFPKVDPPTTSNDDVTTIGTPLGRS